MPDPKKLTIGAPFREFPGDGYNALVDDYLRRKSEKPNAPPQASGSQPSIAVQCHNSTSTTIEPGEILGFSQPIFLLTEDANQVYSAPAVKGITPAAPQHSNQFVVATDYIRGTGDVTGGAVGPAVLMGLAWCKVNWTDDTHTKVKVAEGETMLQSGTSGMTPVWHEDIPDPEYLPATLWALVMLGGGASAELTASFMIVTTEIPAATGDTLEITPGEGEAQPMAIDPDTGVATPAGDPIAVLNYDTCESYAVNTGINVAQISDTDIVYVISAFCCTVEEGVT